jgi:hypothetical protein
LAARNEGNADAIYGFVAQRLRADKFLPEGTKVSSRTNMLELLQKRQKEMGQAFDVVRDAAAQNMDPVFLAGLLDRGQRAGVSKTVIRNAREAMGRGELKSGHLTAFRDQLNAKALKKGDVGAGRQIKEELDAKIGEYAPDDFWRKQYTEAMEDYGDVKTLLRNGVTPSGELKMNALAGHSLKVPRSRIAEVSPLLTEAGGTLTTPKGIGLVESEVLNPIVRGYNAVADKVMGTAATTSQVAPRGIMGAFLKDTNPMTPIRLNRSRKIGDKIGLLGGGAYIEAYE